MIPEFARRVEQARWAAAAIFFLNGLGLGLWAVHIPIVRDRLGLDEPVLGLVLLLIAAGAMGAMPLAGAASSIWGSRRTVITAAVAFVLAIPLPIAAPSAWSLFLAALLFGACNGALDVSMNAHATEVEQARGRPSLSACHGCFSLGGLAGAGTGALLLALDLGDGRGAAFIAALGLLSLLGVARRLLPPANTHQEGSHFGWPRRPALLLGLLALLCMAVEGAVADWSALLLTSHTGASPTVAALGYSAFSIAMALCRFGGDAIVLRLGARRVTLVGGLLIALGLLLAVLAPQPLLAAGGFALVGLGAANVVPVLFAAAGRVPGVSAGAGVATAATIGYAGFLLGPPLIGWLAASIGLAAALGLLSAAGVLIAIGARAAEPAYSREPVECS